MATTIIIEKIIAIIITLRRRESFVVAAAFRINAIVIVILNVVIASTFIGLNKNICPRAAWWAAALRRCVNRRGSLSFRRESR